MDFDAETVTGKELFEQISKAVNTQFENRFKQLFDFEVTFLDKEQVVTNQLKSKLIEYPNDYKGETSFAMLADYLTLPDYSGIRQHEQQDVVRRYTSIVKYIRHWNTALIDAELI